MAACPTACLSVCLVFGSRVGVGVGVWDSSLVWPAVSSPWIFHPPPPAKVRTAKQQKSTVTNPLIQSPLLARSLSLSHYLPLYSSSPSSYCFLPLALLFYSPPAAFVARIQARNFYDASQPTRTINRRPSGVLSFSRHRCCSSCCSRSRLVNQIHTR